MEIWKDFYFTFLFRYLNTYKKYSDLLNNNADQDVSAFLRETHSIEAFKKVTTRRPYTNNFIYISIHIKIVKLMQTVFDFTRVSILLLNI